MDSLEKAVKKSFIDKAFEGGDGFEPELLINNSKEQEYVLTALQKDLSNCETFMISVAFITQSGLASIKTQLADLERLGKKGRLITSDYLAFNQPYVFNDLLKIPNLEVRISEKSGFHSKVYFFKHQEMYSVVIGSSNLTMNALKVNYEWNIRLTSCEAGEITQEISENLESLWDEGTPLTSEWIASYQAVYEEKIARQDVPVVESFMTSKNHNYEKDNLQPNKMQIAALTALARLRESGEKKGLIVSATGTGKTYLAAFDVLAYQPRKMLFIVHREQILEKAKESFQKVIGGKDSDYGILSGNKKETGAKYLFATIQTLSKDPQLAQFAKDYFDYILIDEVHKSGAATYKKVLEYFEPDFLLGMTATPERTDRINIFELFDYNIPYEIRLQDALEEDLLCPFHYFGVTAYEKDGDIIEETEDLKYLATEERVKFLLEKIDYYGCDKNKARGLIFCSRKDEAELLANRFNEMGRASTYLTGDHSISEREKEIERLEADELEYIFTVDIFNEGIDIPKINQVVMLRGTQSNIVFLQQLGRGLRKDPSKEFVTVIDFIGNYKNNYMIPMALAGDVSRNKNNLRKDTFDTSYISGLSSINFEQVAKERIYNSINEAKLDSMKELKESYIALKNRLNRVPYLVDFQEHKQLDPVLLANKQGSYYNFLVKIKEKDVPLLQVEGNNKYLLIASREFLSGMRRHELLLLDTLINGQGRMTLQEIIDLFEKADILFDEETIGSVLGILDLSFFAGGDKKVYDGYEFIQVKNDQIELSEGFRQALTDQQFTKLFQDIIETGYLKNLEYNPHEKLTRYKRYGRKDSLKLMNWETQMVNQNIGGYTRNDQHFLIFITLEKNEDFSAQMSYEDALINPTTLHWYTRSPRTMNSPEVEVLLAYEQSDYDIHVFMKKSNDEEGSNLFYLGEVIPDVATIAQSDKITKDGTKKSVVSMDLHFKEAIEHQLFEYLTSE